MINVWLIILYSNDNDVKFYFGSTENLLKFCFYHHQMTLSNLKYKNSTALSKYFWQLKNDGISPSINWEIISRSKAYNSKGNKCNLCLVEKWVILKHLTNPNLLNKRNELMVTCRHKNKYLLKYTDSD